MTDRLVLILLVDALGYTQAGDRRFLACLDQPRVPVRSVLGYSSAALPTLMSGLYPEEHGHLAMYRRAGRDGVFRGASRWVRPLSRLTSRHWTLRRWVARSLERGGVTGYFSLYDVPLELLGEFDLCQRRDIFGRDAFPDHRGLGDLLARPDARIWNWRVPEARALAALEEEIQRGEARCLLFYSAALDATMHAHGPDSDATRSLLDRYDQTFTRLIQRAEARYREVRVFAFGDHGMAAVTRTHDLMTRLARLDARVRGDLLYFLDSTMARFWYQSDAARREVEALLGGLDCGRLLGDDELSRLRARFPNHDYGEAIFLLRESEILVPSFMSAQPVAGMHGYHPDDTSMYTTLLSNCAALPDTADLTDIHRVLRAEIEQLGAAA